MTQGQVKQALPAASRPTSGPRLPGLTQLTNSSRVSRASHPPTVTHGIQRSLEQSTRRFC